MPGSGRSPAQIEADVAALQEGIRRERANAEALGPAPGRLPRDEPEYHQAVARVARATRALVDYEQRIPEYQREHREHVGARTARRSGGLLTAAATALCIAVVPGTVDAWWLAMLAPLLLAGLWALPGADRRAAGPVFRPRVGAGLFAFAALIALLCCFRILTAWAGLAAPLAAWIGLRAFGATGTVVTAQPTPLNQAPLPLSQTPAPSEPRRTGVAP